MASQEWNELVDGAIAELDGYAQQHPKRDALPERTIRQIADDHVPAYNGERIAIILADESLWCHEIDISSSHVSVADLAGLVIYEALQDVLIERWKGILREREEAEEEVLEDDEEDIVPQTENGEVVYYAANDTGKHTLLAVRGNRVRIMMNTGIYECATNDIPLVLKDIHPVTRQEAIAWNATDGISLEMIFSEEMDASPDWQDMTRDGSHRHMTY